MNAGMKNYENKQRYHGILKAMSPEKRLMKAFELSELANASFKAGLRNKYRDMPEEEFHRLYIEKRLKCHNQNY